MEIDETILRYHKLLKKTFGREHREGFVHTDLLDGYATKLIESARQNGYIVQKHGGPYPRVFLWGVSCKEGDIDQEDNLANILSGNMQEADVLLARGEGPSETDLQKVTRFGLVGKMLDIFKEKGIRVMHNDNSELNKDKKEVERQLAELERAKRCRAEDPEYVRLVGEYIEVLFFKNQSTCYNPLSGIIPVFRGESITKNKIGENARIHQIISLFNLNMYDVQSSLCRENITYLSFVPKINPHLKK